MNFLLYSFILKEREIWLIQFLFLFIIISGIMKKNNFLFKQGKWKNNTDLGDVSE